MPVNRRRSILAARSVEPEPQNGSSTLSPVRENDLRPVAHHLGN
jgi:hypothetical protein